MLTIAFRQSRSFVFSISFLIYLPQIRNNLSTFKLFSDTLRIYVTKLQGFMEKYFVLKTISRHFQPVFQYTLGLSNFSYPYLSSCILSACDSYFAHIFCLWFDRVNLVCQTSLHLSATNIGISPCIFGNELCDSPSISLSITY